MKITIKTEEGVLKKKGDSYYVVQDGSSSGHFYPLEIQLIKLEQSNIGTSRSYYDSFVNLSDAGVKRFHYLGVAKKYLKYLIKLNKNK